ncbi:MAG: hypothetical protein IPM83_15625 [Ignavibacteria bacterium]|nr:hypothetical protein [Ignavibacteria bacterium]
MNDLIVDHEKERSSTHNVEPTLPLKFSPSALDAATTDTRTTLQQTTGMMTSNSVQFVVADLIEIRARGSQPWYCHSNVNIA